MVSLQQLALIKSGHEEQEHDETREVKPLDENIEGTASTKSDWSDEAELKHSAEEPENGWESMLEDMVGGLTG